MSTTTLNALIIAAYKAADAADAAIAAVVPKLAKLGPDKARAACLAAASTHYRVPLIDGAGKATGQKVLDREAANYEAAKKRVQRLLAAAFPKAREDVEVPAELIRAAKALAKLANEYEGARALAAKALAAAFAK